MTTSADTAAPRAWIVTSALAAGLGAGPLLAALAPLPGFTAVGLAAGVLLAVGTLAAESSVAARDVAEARSPLRRSFLVPAAVTAALATLLTSLAVLHSAWGATALARLALVGPAAPTDKVVAGWMGSDQGFLGQAGWQGSPGLLLAILALSVASAVCGGRLTRGRWLAAGLAAALLLQSAAGVALWRARGVTGGALLQSPPAWSHEWRGVLGSLGVGVFEGLLAVGAGTGVLHALRRRSAAPSARVGWLAGVCPLGVTALVALACWPAADVLGQVPLGAPAPYGREAAVLLLAPPSILGASGWLAVFDAGMMLAGLIGACVASQPVLQALQASLGLTARGARATLALLVALVAVPCVLLPGVTEAVLALAAGLLVAAAGLWLGWLAPRRDGPWLARAAGVLLALATLPAAVAAWLAFESLPLGWHENALLRNGLVACGIGAALVAVWWPVLLLVAALRARKVRPPDPASPGPRRTPA